MEVLVSLSILVFILMALYQSYSTSIFVLSSTTNLWKAMSHAQNELLESERATIPPPVSVNQGEFELDDPMSGFRWKKLVQDTTPLAGIMVRQVNYQLLWNEGKSEFTYDADISVNPQYRPNQKFWIFPVGVINFCCPARAGDVLTLRSIFPNIKFLYPGKINFEHPPGVAVTHENSFR